MGRHKKYKSQEEYNEARRASSSRNRDSVLIRRLQRKADNLAQNVPSICFTDSYDSHSISSLKDDSSPSNTPPATPEREESPPPTVLNILTSEQCILFEDYIPAILHEELTSARRCAPISSRLEECCDYWRLVYTKLTREDKIFYIVFNDLVRTLDREAYKLELYSRLDSGLERTEDEVHRSIRHALDDDPSGRSRLCQTTKEVARFVSSITLPLRKMIIFRKKGIKEFHDKAATGEFKHKVV
ncbi:hypothetical protein SCHPADRAFT_947962 [Schizopora paradoxa]|uniref:Uncharacterized protein n=1 Tax=Schizopora paradoxa TaxID=27342 RepID=A0A0H2QYP8_9AGAM|nr:hypothetical protein SCHPADRAFT_947962 [Schizopora paradoxa]